MFISHIESFPVAPFKCAVCEGGQFHEISRESGIVVLACADCHRSLKLPDYLLGSFPETF